VVRTRPGSVARVVERMARGRQCEMRDKKSVADGEYRVQHVFMRTRRMMFARGRLYDIVFVRARASQTCPAYVFAVHVLRAYAFSVAYPGAL